jgi:hypothetical protein
MSAWIKVDESQPTNDFDMLVTDGEQLYFATWDKGRWWMRESKDRHGILTHWMEVKLPGEEDGQ